MKALNRDCTVVFKVIASQVFKNHLVNGLTKNRQDFTADTNCVFKINKMWSQHNKYIN